MKGLKRFILVLVAALFLGEVTVMADPFFDDTIFHEDPQAIYEGRTIAPQIINNIKFTDMGGHWAGEAVARSGAFNLVKGYNRRYSPENAVSNEEAIAFVIRVLGLEEEALQAGEEAKANFQNESTRSLWSLGYLAMARDLEIISPAEYNSATQPEIEERIFIRGNNASREDVAKWLYRGMQVQNPNAFGSGQVQGALQYSDWGQVDIEALQAVEALTANNVMKGSGGKFRPKASLTRAEMAQILRNMDEVYLAGEGLTKKTGTIANEKNDGYETTGSNTNNRDLYIRTGSGHVEVIRYQTVNSNSVQPANKDAVTFKGGVGGLGQLTVGDKVEYIVDGEGTVYYVQVFKGEKKSVEGKLNKIDRENRTISILDDSNNKKTYSYRNDLIRAKDGAEGKYEIIMRDELISQDKWYDIDTLVYGGRIRLNLENGVIMTMDYIGEPVVITEVRGIVTSNDKDFGVLTIVNNKGEYKEYRYFEGDTKVKKQEYYDTDDEIGYMDEVFGYFGFNPRDSTMSSIEPGDIVFIRPADGQPDVIRSISASTNYIMRYGKVKQVDRTGDLVGIMLEFEDKRTAWYDAAPDIFVSQDGKPVHMNDLVVGDWVKLLVNEATIAPGMIYESVKEITIEGADHFISTIVKGELNGFNKLQNKMLLEHTETLSKNGWVAYKNIDEYDLTGGDTEYFVSGKQVSKDYMERFFKRGGASVYIAMENSFTGEKAAKVSVRTSRDEYIKPDFIVGADGSGSFYTMNQFMHVLTDPGTIVRRHGRLVDGSAILPQDYASVVLNGQNQAAVVDVFEEPGVSAIGITRGRLKTVAEKDFRLESMATLYGMKWVYTPIERLYDIDHTTRFFDESGIISKDEFLAGAETLPSDKVYYIVSEGSKAKFVLDLPYATKGVRGRIASIDEGIRLNEATVYDDKTGRWSLVSEINSHVILEDPDAVLVIKNNKVVTMNDLELGDQLRVLTNTLPDRTQAGMNVNPIIILVEK